MFSSLFGLTVLSLATLPFGAVASSHGAHHRRHEGIAAHVNATANATEPHLHRRGQTFTNARLTYYDVGMGACGQKNVPSDFIVALNGDSYGDQYPGPNCFRPIEITYNGKSAKATIMDKCPGCPSPGGLDLSTGLFSYLAPLSEGVLYATWRYLDEGDDPAPASTSTSQWQPPTSTWTPPATTSSKQHHTTTSTWSPEPEPTTTWSSSSEAEPTTSSWTPSSTWSSSSAWSSPPPSSSSHASSSSSSSSATSSSAAAASSAPAGPDTLGKLNQAVLGLTEVMLAGVEVNAGAQVNN